MPNVEDVGVEVRL